MANKADLADQLRTTRKQVKHTGAIDALVASRPGMQKKGFWRSVREVLAGTDSADVSFPFTPDAFYLDHEKQIIEVHEVVVSNDLSANKMRLLAAFWFEMDCDDETDWLPTLIVHREGAGPQEYNLCFTYHHFMVGDHRPNQHPAAGFLFPISISEGVA